MSIPLVGEQVVALLGHPDIGWCAPIEREKPTGERGTIAPARVVGPDRRRLPLPADDEPQNVIRHVARSEEHTSELQSRSDLVCRLLLEKKNIMRMAIPSIIAMSIG